MKQQGYDGIYIYLPGSQTSKAFFQHFSKRGQHLSQPKAFQLLLCQVSMTATAQPELNWHKWAYVFPGHHWDLLFKSSNHLALITTFNDKQQHITIFIGQWSELVP